MSKFEFALMQLHEYGSTDTGWKDKIRAELARVTKERDEWRDYWGCDSPHDSHITIGSLNPYARQLGNEQARANTAANQLVKVTQERDLLAEKMERALIAVAHFTQRDNESRAELAALKKRADKQYEESMIAHRFIEELVGEHTRGRDFSVKVPMAEKKLAALKAERAPKLEGAREALLELRRHVLHSIEHNWTLDADVVGIKANIVLDAIDAARAAEKEGQ